ncbi:MAG: hypothetical protein HY913_04625 [Desulfomonile tiedjei]|nr:hypothetical protein [Desulfomonile tiedjei]
MGEGRKKISVSEALADIKSGLSDRELAEKYGLSGKQLEILFTKLVEAGQIAQSELDARKKALSGTIELDEEPPAQAPLEPSPARSREAVPIVPTASGQPVLPDEVARRYSRNAAMGICLSIVLSIFGSILGQFGDLYAVVGMILSAVSIGLYFWGFYCLAKKKGYHGAYALLGLVPCLIGLLIMLLLPDKYSEAAPKSGWLVALIVVAAGMVFVAVLGIILAIAIPYYVAYKRAACDRMAGQELARVQEAYDKYRKDPNNGTQAPPESLTHLLGPYYGWQGTSERCDVRIHYDRDGQTVSAVSIKGAHPSGVSSRYVYKRHLGAGQEQAAEVVPQADESRFLSYPAKATGRDRSCFSADGRLLEECMKAGEKE